MMIKIIRAKNQLRPQIWLHRRGFSSLSSSDSEEQDQTFPYIFLNQNRDLIKRIETTSDEDAKFWEQYKLDDGFILSYTSLLDAISKNDSEMIAKICEKRLLREW